MREQILYSLFIVQWHVPEDDGWAFPKPGILTPFQHEYAGWANSEAEKS